LNKIAPFSPATTKKVGAKEIERVGENSPALQAENGGIVVRHVNVIYRNGHKALEDASFTSPPASITALVGVNGAGKSTLFKAMMGFVPLRGGEISVLGMKVRDALRQNLIAYVPQSEDVDWNFPVLVEDVVMMGRYGKMNFLRLPRRADHQAVDEALARVDMSAYRKRQIGELSGGQRKRVFLARALAQGARLILLDEPFTGVDATTQQQIIQLLRQMRGEGAVMLVSTHDLGSVPEFCDRTVLVKNTILASGPTELVLTAQNLEHAFGGALRARLLPASLQGAVSIVSDDERPLVFEDGKTVKQRQAG